MSILPGEKLHYAETHFKFKLPWSLLYKPWPEIQTDAPFQFVPGIEPTLWIVVRDAHRFPTLIEKIDISIAGTEDFRASKTVDLQIRATEQFGFYPVKLGKLPAGNYDIDCRISAKRINENGVPTADKERSFSRWNLPGLKPAPLKIQVLAEEPPKAPGFVAGETHCHTHYSADHVEHGASPAVLQQAAKAVGLDFVSCTDHAYDFAYTTEDYTKEADTPLTRFEALREEVRKLNEADDMPLMIAGEEVSSGNSKGENVHMTVLGPEGYLPGLGDCGRNWLDNKPTFKISKLLEMTTAHCFAAHPMQPMGYLEKFIFRRGYWSHKDLNLDASHKIRGIQFWNGIRDEGFKLGRDWWIEELGKGNFLLPIGGNDAHGDLNDTTSVSLPLISLKHTRDHVFGKVRTVVKVNQSVILSEDRQVVVEGSKKNLSLEALNEAFAGDNCYITDGPALWWERGEKTVTFHARNTQDFGGAFRYIRIYGRRRNNNGKLAPHEELCMESLVAAPTKTDISVNADNFAYLRAECETATGKFAMTSAAVLA
ncbi:PHP domain-containing protein [Fibrobacter sp.]|uniref:PHP domain-containing protein n=1 Tax=Fibrobacter sp. TaxID=35828 RepID=UPI003870CE50